MKNSELIYSCSFTGLDDCKHYLDLICDSDNNYAVELRIYDSVGVAIRNTIIWFESDSEAFSFIEQYFSDYLDEDENDYVVMASLEECYGKKGA